MATPLPKVNAAINLVDDDNDNINEVDIDTVQLFKFYAKIVGKRHYTAVLNDGEIVYLLRQPENAYDRNAIQVQSINHQQVGHISAGSSTPNVAAFLAPIMDYALTGGVGCSVEAVSINQGKTSQFNSAVLITLVGLPGHREAVKTHLIRHKMGYTELGVHQPHLTTNCTGNQVSVSSTQSPMSPSGVPVSTKPAANFHVLTEDEIIKSLDGIWTEQQKELDDLSFKACDFPNLVNCFISELFPHQEVGVAWMRDRELKKSDLLPPFYSLTADNKYLHALTCHSYDEKPLNIRGGILADAMGLGKSVMILALCLSNPPKGKDYQRPVAVISTGKKRDSENIKVGDNNDEWLDDVKVDLENSSANELNKMTKTQLKAELKSMGHKQTGSKEDLVDRIQYNRNGDNNPPTVDGFETAATLIVCPLSVISAWQDQISTHLVEGSVKVVTYHGPQRKTVSLRDLREADFVLTTYDVISSEVSIPEEDTTTTTSTTSSTKKAKAISPLEQINWWRIVLDEAHVIRNCKVRRHKTVVKLKSHNRWAVSGTPIVNSIDDLDALTRFLQLQPFHLDISLFKRYFTRPIKTADLAKIRTLMKTIALKREKKDVDCDLPTKTEAIVHVELSPSEREAYDCIHAFVTDYTMYLEEVAAGGMAGNQQAVLALITRLRQACLDLSLVPANKLVQLLSQSKKTKVTNEDGTVNTDFSRFSESDRTALTDRLMRLFAAAGAIGGNDASEDDEVDIECSICMEPLTEETVVIFRACQHIFCEDCVERLFNLKRSINCPLCRTVVKQGDYATYKEMTAANKALDESNNMKDEAAMVTVVEKVNSSKTVEILKCLNQTRSNGLGEKTVIFSSFVSYLSILQKAIERDGFVVARIDGSCSQKARAKEIHNFSNNPFVAVILCSIKACGVGITLTAANNIYLTDLWWAPSVDLQAIDRVHRIGQTRPVQVVRFLVKDSIDEKIFELQKKKIELSKLTFDKNVDLKGQRARDIQQLLA